MSFDFHFESIALFTIGIGGIDAELDEVDSESDLWLLLIGADLLAVGPFFAIIAGSGALRETKNVRNNRYPPIDASNLAPHACDILVSLENYRPK